ERVEKRVPVVRQQAHGQVAEERRLRVGLTLELRLHHDVASASRGHSEPGGQQQHQSSHWKHLRGGFWNGEKLWHLGARIKRYRYFGAAPAAGGPRGPERST